MSISLSSSNLTKLVTFTPYYVITNHTTLTIQYQEGNQTADSWRDIKPTDCSPLWPRGQGHHNSTLRLKVQGTNEMTAPFSFTKNHTVLLKLHNKVCTGLQKYSNKCTLKIFLISILVNSNQVNFITMFSYPTKFSVWRHKCECPSVRGKYFD